MARKELFSGFAFFIIFIFLCSAAAYSIYRIFVYADNTPQEAYFQDENIVVTLSNKAKIVLKRMNDGTFRQGNVTATLEENSGSHDGIVITKP